MKFLFPVILFCCFAVDTTFAQTTDTSSSTKQQRWVQMMMQPNANFYDIQREFNDYWTGRERAKGDGWKAFKRWEYYWQERIMPDGSFPNGLELINALDKKIKDKAQRSRSKSNTVQTPVANFTLMGPATAIPSNGGSGRLVTIAFHPTNNSIMWVGSPAGGLWKTTNNGVGWTSNTDQFATLGVSAISIDANDPSTMFIGTGDRDASDTYGTGIYKSTDGGASWNATGLAYAVQSFFIVARILIHPTQSNIILAATSSGIWKSVNGGTSWTQKTNTSTKDMVFVPSNPNYLYAAVGGAVYRSTNLGETWSLLSTGFTSSAVNRVSLAVCVQNPRCVYALCSNSSNSTFNGIYRSLDTGNTWSLRASTPNILGGAADGSDTRGQGWYDLCMAVNPGDSNDVFIGGINTWRSTNGGTAWTCKSMWYTGTSLPYIHADEHDMWYKPGTNEMYVCNDGGLFRTTNGGTNWTDLSAGLQVMEFYRISQSSSSATKLLGGAQDNGTNFFNAGGWSQVYGGDGMDNAIDQSNDAVLYASSQNGNFGRSTNNGTSFSTITPSGKGGTGSWVTPITLDAANNVYLAYTSVYKSTNQGTAWSTIGTNVLTSTANYLHVAASNSNYIVVGNASLLFRTTNGGTSWTSIKGSLPSSISRIAIHPTGPDTMVAVMSSWSAGNKVYKTTNGGTTWSNISGSLPNIPVDCAVYENNSVSGLYIGSDIGIYYRNNNMSDWISFDDGLPNVRVNDLEVFYSGSKLRAGTYGRGAWQGNLYTDGPQAAMSASRTTVCVADTLTLFDVSTNGATSRTWSIPGASPSTSTLQNPVIVFMSPGQYSVTLVAINQFGTDTLTYTNFITVYNTPQSSFSISQTSACLGDSIVCTGPSGMTGYRWSTGDSTQSIILRNTGSYQIQLSVTDNHGCTSTSAVQSFSIYAAPTTTISGDNKVCVGNQGIYRSSFTTPGSTYRWFKPRTGVIIGDSTGSQVVYTWPTAGLDTVHMRETNVRGCTVDRFIPISINVIPTVGITGPLDGCQNTLQTFSTSSISPGATIEWKQPHQGSIVGSNNNTSGVNIMWTTVGLDSVVAEVTSSAGCVSASSYRIQVKLAPTPVINGAIAVCVDEESSYQTADVPGSTYKWSLPPFASFVGDSTRSTVRVRFTQSGKDNIHVIETNSVGCSRDALVIVTAVAAPTTSVSGVTSACVGFKVRYSAAQIAENTYSWFRPKHGTVIGDTSHSDITVEWSVPGVDTLIVTESNPTGCKTSVIIPVNIQQQLKPQLNSSTGKYILCQGEKLRLNAESGYGTYTWSRNGSVVLTAVNSLVVSEDGLYSLFVESGNCNGSSDTIRVRFYETTPRPVLTSPAVNILHCEPSGMKYEWFVNNVSIDGATNQEYKAGVSGNYCVRITDSNACKSEIECLNYIVSVDENVTSDALVLEPNPAEEEFRVKFSGYSNHQIRFSMYDDRSRKILSRNFGSSEELSSQRFDLRDVAQGVYIVILEVDGVRCYLKRLIRL